MIFRRSDFGVSNLHLFHRVDAVVYLEGKTDIRLWQAIFKEFRPKGNFEFRQLGGCEELDEYIAAIESGDLTNTVACRDRDYLDFIGEISPARNVVYTFGYSIENDLFNGKTAVEIVTLRSNLQFEPGVLNRYFNTYVRELKREVEPFLKTDIGLAFDGDGIIRRKGSGDLFSFSRNSLPKFDQVEAEARRNSARQPNISILGPVFPRYFHGHSLMRLLDEFCRYFVHRNRFAAENIAFSILKRMLSRNLAELMDDESRAHYEKSLAGIIL